MADSSSLDWIAVAARNDALHRPLRNFVYSEKFESTDAADENGVYCCLNYQGERVIEPFGYGHLESSFEVLEHVSKTFKDRDFLGRRRVIRLEDGTTCLGEYLWWSYTEAVELIKVIGTALTSEKDLLVETSIEGCDIVKSGKFLGIWSLNCPYWLMTDYASIAYGLITVPIYETLGDEALLQIMSETRMRAVCIDSKKLANLTRLKSKITHLKTLVIFDEITEGDKNVIRDLGLSYVMMDDLIKRYKDRVVQPPKASKRTICTVIYTSGTSGCPKGAVFDNEGLLILTSRMTSAGLRLKLTSGDTFLSYLPLSHVYERFVEHYAAALGARIGYYGGNIREILDDIQELRPHILLGVPRAFTKFLARIRDAINKKGCIARCVAKTVINAKRKIFIKRPERPTHWLYDKLVMSKIKGQFGGRLSCLVLGSAAMTGVDIIDLQNYVTAPISEGYGTTETGVVFLQDYRDMSKGTIGGPLAGVTFKLKSVPELLYDAKGDPPRGELYVKGKGFMLGYFANPTLTREVLDADGWYKTGDIVEITPNFGVRILDRAKNFFKLSQGEYIAPEKLENVYINCPMVEQIFIHGESVRNHIVGIVVVNPDLVRAWATSVGLDANASIVDLCKNADLYQQLSRNFEKLAVQNGLNSLEKLKVFLVTHLAFSTDNGMLTPTFKSVRTRIRQVYKAELEHLYANAANLGLFA